MSKKQNVLRAHEILDKELEEDSRINTKPSNKQSTRNEIVLIQKRLNDLQKNLQKVDLSENYIEEKEDSFDNQMKNALGKVYAGKKKINFQNYDEEEEDSESQDDIYAKIQQNKKQKVVQREVKDVEKQENNVYIPKNYSRGKSQQKKKTNNSFRNSLRSIKSIKSAHSKKSIDSKRSFSIKGSQHSERSKVKNLELENAKDLKKMSNLEKELKHYKRLAKTLQEKLEDYRVMEIQFKKLQGNFAKSEQIRKQQKKIIQNLKKH